jgi:hypothetical protein
MLAGPKPRVFTFLSALKDNEKSEMLVNLGVSVARQGQQILMVDARSSSDSRCVVQCEQRAHLVGCSATTAYNARGSKNGCVWLVSIDVIASEDCVVQLVRREFETIVESI